MISGFSGVAGQRSEVSMLNWHRSFLSAIFWAGYLQAPVMRLPFPVALRLAAQDLKAFYFEAVIAKPGATVPQSGEFNNWFWQETTAGKILKAVKERCLTETDKALRLAGILLLVPMSQA